MARILATHPDIFSLPYETGAFAWENGWPKWHRVVITLAKVAASGRNIWVEKSPGHVNYTEEIRRTMPGARFIISTRDGRDVVASLNKRYDDPEKSFARWVRDTAASKSCIERGDSLVWRYEDFISNPPDSLRSVCDFIGVTFRPEMLDYHEKPVIWGRQRSVRTEHSLRRWSQVNQPITDYRGIWRTNLPQGMEERFATGEARELMTFFGYGH
ncbi:MULTISPECIES: sulfotransferase [unclassified Mesorhizobium]|uniref:sulfotransferase family protein n=1 Tax=unclassified Mesorhizobium TaxID=325217 RepID=UPI0012FF6C9F|nr:MULTISPECIES: sulfotransferase [unclassified Mesorhizobium]